MRKISSHILAPFTLIILVMAVYSGGIYAPFHYDDIHSIRDNISIRKLSNIPLFFSNPEMFTSDPRSAMYRPLLLTTYALNFSFGELITTSYHWVNIFIHSINSVLLFFVSRCLGLRSNFSFLAALLFAMHPVNGETVNYISSRSESLCALNVLLCFLCYFKAVSQPKVQLTSYLLSMVFAGAALLSKSIGVMILPTLIVYESSYFGFSRVRLVWKRYIPIFALTVSYVYALRSMLDTAFLKAPVRDISINLSTQIKALIGYIDWLFFPWPLSVDPNFSLGADVCLLFLSVALVLSLVYLWTKTEPLFRFGGAWAFLSILPTLTIPLNVLVNEHRIYIASMGFSLILCGLLQRFNRGKSNSKSIWIILLIVLFTRLNLLRTEEWSTTENLWVSSIRTSPNMPRPHIFIGDLYRERGQFTESITSYTQALSIYPEILSGGDLFSIYTGIGASFLAQGRWEQAEKFYLNSLNIDSNNESSLEALEGIRALKKDRSRENNQQLVRSGLLALVDGDVDTAIDLFQKALTIFPEIAIYQILAQAYERIENWNEAVAIYEEIVDKYPTAQGAETARARLQLLKLKQVED